MNPVRFLMALPRRAAPCKLGHLSIAADISAACADHPALWVDPATPRSTLAGGGVLVGHVFSRETWRHLTSFNRHDGAASAGAIAADLATSCWGGYVAILPDTERNHWGVMADPSGLLPVYNLATTDHIFLTTHPDLIGPACGTRPQVCWHELQRYLLRPEFRGRRTCLVDMDELAPGVLIFPTSRDLRPRQFWHAEEFLPRRWDCTFEEACEDLRAISTRVLGCWADLTDHIAVAASGGVDSSLICAALKESGRDFACVTLATADNSGDERDHVRMLARHFGVAVAEQVYDPVSFHMAVCASAGLPRPSRRPFLTAIDRMLSIGAAEVGAELVLDGNGGDNLFCYLHSSAPLVDRLLVEGPHNGIIETLFDMCRVTGCDVPTVLRAAGRRLARRNRAARWPADHGLLANRAEQAQEADPLTPWLDVDVGRHGGKRDHLMLIMKAQNHIHGLSGNAQRLSPLMSQPLLEFCLGVPTWIWPHGGINRSLARQAFASSLPPQVLRRTSKAGPDSFVRRAFDLNRAAVRDLLLGGMLDAQGLLDRSAVEQALAMDTSHGGSTIYRLLDLAETENWVRSWLR